MRARFVFLLGGLLLFAFFPRAASARTWHLFPGGGGDAPSIAGAMLRAAPGDTVLLACGTYYEHDIQLTPGICLRSETGQWDCATIDAQSQGRVLHSRGLGAGIILEGLTITHGAPYRASGGGLWGEGGFLRATRCRFTVNGGMSYGGGILFNGGALLVEDCLFDENSTTTAIDPGGWGAGIAFGGADLVLRRTVFLDNTALDGGGAVWAESVVDADDCTFVRNNGSYWGAIECGDAVLSGCTFLENPGPAIYPEWGASITNTIIAFGDYAVDEYGAVPEIACCDVYGNSEGDWVGRIQGLDGGNGNFSADPLFCDMQGQDWHLLSVSPCAPAQQPDCGRIGAYDVGCQDCSPRVWSLAADGSGDQPTIQAAVDVACFRDTLELADGVYRGDGNRDIDFRGKLLSLRSRSGNPDACMLDCEGSAEAPHRGLLIGPKEAGSVISAIGEAQIMGIGIVNGYAAGTNYDRYGGGILCIERSPEIRNCAIVRCHADYLGGGIFSTGGSPAILSCRVIENSAGAWGGGIGLSYGSPIIEGNWIIGNVSATSGGGICLSRSHPARLSGNLICENTAFQGGGLYCFDAAQTFGRNTLSHNSASSGGAVYLNQTVNTFDSSLVTFSPLGGAVACDRSTAALHCCDVFGNADGDWVGCIAGQIDSSGNFASDPLYCAPERRDYGLLPDSPCLPGHHPEGADCGTIGALPEGCGGAETGIAAGPEPGALGAGHRFSLGPVEPNPFGRATTVRYDIAADRERSSDARVALRIYDATGRLVRVLVDREQPSGSYAIRWDGSDSQGRPVATGVYFCLLHRGKERMVQRMVLMR